MWEWHTIVLLFLHKSTLLYARILGIDTKCNVFKKNCCLKNLFWELHCLIVWKHLDGQCWHCHSCSTLKDRYNTIKNRNPIDYFKENKLYYSSQLFKQRNKYWKSLSSSTTVVVVMEPRENYETVGIWHRVGADQKRASQITPSFQH